jgi:hypothetical protein
MDTFRYGRSQSIKVVGFGKHACLFPVGQKTDLNQNAGHIGTMKDVERALFDPKVLQFPKLFPG